MNMFKLPSLMLLNMVTFSGMALMILTLATSAVGQTGTPIDDAVAKRQMEKGAYIAHAADCAACHTASREHPFAGGLPLKTPFGTIYSTNITPDPDHGIGQYSFSEFDRAMRSGVARDGHHLYPAMPYTAFARISNDDMQSLFIYMKHGVNPISTENRKNDLPWPFSMRSLMIGWNLLFLTKGEYVSDASRSAGWNRGAYLVEGLGHCGSCHTPRGVAGQEKAFTDADGKHYLAGTVIDNWYAPNLKSDFGTGLHDWSQAEIAEFLKSGRTTRSAAFGGMVQVVGESTQYLNEQDRMAIAEYLKSLPPVSDSSVAAGTATGAIAVNATPYSLRNEVSATRGAQLYLNNCNACHRSDGNGSARTFPSLAKSEIVNAKDPTSLIHIVLTGSAMPSTMSAPSALAMPDFAWRLDDEDLAEVLTFVRSRWGNQAPAVAASDVAYLRKELLY